MSNENIASVSNFFKVVSTNCVNSKWIADWLATEDEEHCQCGYKCKVKVDVAKNGHPPYTFVVDIHEFRGLQKEMTMK